MFKTQVLGGLTLLPVLAWAVPDDGNRGLNLEQLLRNFVDVIITPLVTLLFAVALLMFIWGLFQMMVELSNGGDGKTGKSHMVWGIVGLTIMVAVWGIIGIISNSIGVDTSGMIQGTGGFK